MGHLSQKKLENRIDAAKRKVEVGARYYHYKDPSRTYEVLAVGLQEATEESCVIYQAEYGANMVWVRNLGDWNGTVELKGKKVSRFQKK